MHMRMDHDEQVFSCDKCDLTSKGRTKLKTHMIEKHDVFSCEKCGVTRKGKIKLKSHMQSHREISCKHCEKKIPSNSRSSHMRKCLGEKKLECEHCQALFQTKDSLIKHLTRKSCSIKCNFCDKSLKGEFNLKKHMASFHCVETQVVETIEGHVAIFQSTEFRKDLKCTVCEFIAAKPSKLKRHMVRHKPKPQKVLEMCPKCGLTLKYKSDFNRHIQTSHGERSIIGKSRASQYRRLQKIKITKENQLLISDHHV